MQRKLLRLDFAQTGGTGFFHLNTVKVISKTLWSGCLGGSTLSSGTCGVNPSMRVFKREALLSPDTISVLHCGKCFMEQNQNKLFI